MKAFFHGLAASSAMLAAVPFAAPAIAQTSQSEIIVYGTDPCPRETENLSVVCVRRPAEERFRIPPKLRPSGPRQVRNSWVNQSKVFANQGATGPMSCSAVGPAGHTGCALQQINQAAREVRDTDAQEVAPK